MESVVPRDRSIADLLSHASSSDLEVLADLITDGGKGRVALDSNIKAIILKRREQGTLQTIAEVLEAEIRAFGGNSVVNLFRSGGVGYAELATDVAKMLGGKPAPTADIFDIEAIVMSAAIDKYAPGTTASVEAGGAPLSIVLGQIVQELAASSSTIVGIATTDVAAGGAAGAIGTVGALGVRIGANTIAPIAIASGGATIVQSVGPAFRITIPAVLQIAKIRRARFEADFATYTEGLRACL